jgi:acetyl-CoA carboxylase carboxyl transferase subunit alpha
LTAEDLKSLGVIDEIVPEPLGGAHRGTPQTVAALGDAIERALGRFANLSGIEIRDLRRQKFLEMGRQGLDA